MLLSNAKSGAASTVPTKEGGTATATATADVSQQSGSTGTGTSSSSSCVPIVSY
jgi:hypothetical protein